MLMEYWKTKKFSVLSKKWDKKLSESGFIDIEKEVNGSKTLKQFANHTYQTNDEIKIQAKTEYFNIVGQLCHSDKTISKRDRIIIIGHSNGLRQKEILRNLEKGGMKCNRLTITRTITRFLEKWKIPSKPRKTR